MQKITSKDNTIVKNIIQLNKSAKHRREQRAFVTEGIRLCNEALASENPLELVCFSESFLKKHNDFYLTFQCKCPVYILSDSVFARICDTQTPQGVLCVVKMLDKTLDSDKIKTYGKILALENLQDPNNMGTIIRTAEALSVDTILISSGSCDIYSPKVVRGSMGAIFRQNIIFTSDLISFLKDYNKIGTSFAAVLSDDAALLNSVRFPENSLVVIGNEGNGISNETAQICTQRIMIPMNGKAESLNAAIAAGILMWEMVK